MSCEKKVQPNPVSISLLLLPFKMCFMYERLGIIMPATLQHCCLGNTKLSPNPTYDCSAVHFKVIVFPQFMLLFTVK